MLSKKTMTVAEVAEFAAWLKTNKGWDADTFLQDPDAFEDEFHEYEHGPEPVGPYVAGHEGVRDLSTGITVEP